MDRNLPVPLEDARSIRVGMKGRFCSSHVTLRHPLLVPALIIVCNHSALIPTLWVPSGPLPSLLFDMRPHLGFHQLPAHCGPLSPLRPNPHDTCSSPEQRVSSPPCLNKAWGALNKTYAFHAWNSPLPLISWQIRRD